MGTTCLDIHPGPVDPVSALVRSGGAARTADLYRLGVCWPTLRAAVDEHAVLKQAPGLWSLPGCAAPALARAALGTRGRAALSCGSAAAEHGLVVLDPDPRPHVVTGRSAARTWPGTVVHRRASGPGTDRLGLVETLVSVAQCSPLHVAVSLVDQVLADDRVLPAALRAAGAPRERRWHEVVDLADRRAGSAMESLARVHLALAFAGLGVRVEPQVHLRGLGRVDLLVDGWLVVETDGFAFHADRASYREDRRRNGVLSRHGYVWLRPTFEDVVARPDRMVREVLETWTRGRPPWWVDLRVR